jgi:4-methyl-5(b-hydroxyethyl)-thiazole monophosphate biosynthesis
MEEGIEKYCLNGENINECLKNSSHKKNVPFVVDGNVITGRGPGTAEEFAMELVKLLTNEETYNSIKKGSIQR